MSYTKLRTRHASSTCIERGEGAYRKTEEGLARQNVRRGALSTHARVEAAHVAVWHTSTVDNLVSNHGFPCSSGTLFVDRSRLEPMFLRDQAEFHLRVSDSQDAPVIKSAHCKCIEEVTHSLNSSENGSSLRKT